MNASITSHEFDAWAIAFCAGAIALTQITDLTAWIVVFGLTMAAAGVVSVFLVR